MLFLSIFLIGFVLTPIILAVLIAGGPKKALAILRDIRTGRWSVPLHPTDPWQADRDAIAGDWRMVGQDMRVAAERLAEEGLTEAFARQVAKERDAARKAGLTIHAMEDGQVIEVPAEGAGEGKNEGPLANQSAPAKPSGDGER